MNITTVNGVDFTDEELEFIKEKSIVHDPRINYNECPRSVCLSLWKKGCFVKEFCNTPYVFFRGIAKVLSDFFYIEKQKQELSELLGTNVEIRTPGIRHV